ncbi:TlpA family protein disulfide reductase [Winogradskyella arenosi]|uniref:Thiol-disulfide isomerase/thioredoxin n=1 Tax=Winogradskyella arenosi TaxID=533325 RepID=A0A368ZDD4_9FLAO|nr:TlpA disulfide reductase family protein [Winogradskyella arenosi]RCW91208.1 thiol-disulfide isomerase/thioredoxin [Winogradskyella arenosi]
MHQEKPQKSKKEKVYNISFIVIILLLLIPQTRMPLQVVLHKGLSYIKSSSMIEEEQQIQLDDLNWILKEEDGNTINFSRTKGKVVLINFWATWCPPCIAEMPSLQALYEDYGDEVVFLFVTNDAIETVEAFKEKRGFNFKSVQPITKPPQGLLTSSIPRTLIINKYGAIVVDETGAVNWNSASVRAQLDALLAETL